LLLGNPSESKFDFCYAGNVAHGHLLAAAQLSKSSIDGKLTEGKEQVAGNAYHLSDENHQNFFAFFEPFARSKGLQLPRIYLPYRIVYLLACTLELLQAIFARIFPSGRWFDPSLTIFVCNLTCQDYNFTSMRARRDFDYRPLFDKDTAMQRTMRWVKKLEI